MIHRYFASHAGRYHRRLVRLGAPGIAGTAANRWCPSLCLFVRRLRAGRPRRTDGDSAAQAADRHGAPAGRAHDAGPAVVAVAARRSGDGRATPESRLRTFALAGLGVLVLQIALGGWTSSNYAAVACPDFPTCQQFVVAAHGFPRRLRAVARSGHRLRGRRARQPGARGHSLHASAGRAGRGPELAWPGSAGGAALRRGTADNGAASAAVLAVLLQISHRHRHRALAACRCLSRHCTMPARRFLVIAS